MAVNQACLHESVDRVFGADRVLARPAELIHGPQPVVILGMQKDRQQVEVVPIFLPAGR